MQRRQPLQAEQQLGTRRQLEARHHRGAEQIDVGLIEAVEQDQAVGACPIELPRHVPERREERAQLDRNRNRDAPLQIGDEVADPRLDAQRRFVRIDALRSVAGSLRSVGSCSAMVASSAATRVTLSAPTMAGVASPAAKARSATHEP